MKDKSHGEEVLKVLGYELDKDKVHSRVLGMTRLGLVEMTRKKTRASLGTLLAEECPVCQGRGRTPHSKEISHQLMRGLYNLRERQEDKIVVRVSSEVLDIMRDEGKNLAVVKEHLGKEIEIIFDPELTEPFSYLPGATPRKNKAH